MPCVLQVGGGSSCGGRGGLPWHGTVVWWQHDEQMVRGRDGGTVADCHGMQRACLGVWQCEVTVPAESRGGRVRFGSTPKSACM